VELNFGRIVESLWDNRTGSPTVATPDQMTIEAQNNGLRVRFIASKLAGNKTDGVFEVYDGSGLLLIARTR
jgi:hypothetical protein